VQQLMTTAGTQLRAFSATMQTLQQGVDGRLQQVLTDGSDRLDVFADQLRVGLSGMERASLQALSGDPNMSLVAVQAATREVETRLVALEAYATLLQAGTLVVQGSVTVDSGEGDGRRLVIGDQPSGGFGIALVGPPPSA
jgi:hypothetical protein